MSLNLSDIKNFLIVSETLNVTRASEIAGVTQPTLSYSIKRLEKELGGPLLIRLKNGVRLTKLGEEFTTKAHKLMFDWEDLQRLVSNEQDEIAGKYTLGVHPSVALYTLEHFLIELKENYQKVEFQLTHGLSREITEKVINWELDFGIVVNPKEHPDLVIHQLCLDKVGLFGTDKKNTTLIYDKELNQSDYIIKKLSKLKLNFDQHLTSGNLEVVAKLASIGHGVGILPERVANQYDNLKMLNKEVFFKDKICLIYRVEKHKDQTGKTIIKTIKSGDY